MNTLLQSSFIQISNLIRNSNNLKLGHENSLQNKTGDLVKELDILSHNIIVDEIKTINEIAGYISEESEEICFTSPNGKYIVAFDPLDGSSNINCNVTVGTIYGIYLWDSHLKEIGDIIDAGYCLYGPCTNLVRTEEGIVKMYQLNSNNEFDFISELSLEGNTMKIYSINESNYYDFKSAKIRQLLMDYKIKKYNLRLVGSMVADCHRTLIQGGVFIYPATNGNPDGKLRLAYESMPMALIFETCGGLSLDGYKSILEHKIDLKNIHQKIPTFLGSKEEIRIIQNINL